MTHPLRAAISSAAHVLSVESVPRAVLLDGPTPDALVQLELELATSGLKRCRQCGQVKPITEYYRARLGAQGVKSKCKQCLCRRRPPEQLIRPHPPTLAGHKWCPRCKQLLPESAFYFYPGRGRTRSSALSAWCKRCSHIYRTASRSGLSKFTSQRYADALAQQHGVCAICGQTETNSRARHLAIDHDHKTGAFRGLLCNRCNQGLGYFNDDLARLEQAIAYLRRSHGMSE